MRKRLLVFQVIAAIITSVFSVSAQSPVKEHIYMGGQFAIAIPHGASSYRTTPNTEIGGNKFLVSSYQWSLGKDVVGLSYGDGAVDLENPANVETYFNAIRDTYVKGLTQPASVVEEKRISLENHPGLNFTVDSAKGRRMGWIYLLKTRFYFLALSLTDPNTTEENIRTVSTFRFVSWAELGSRYPKLVEEMTPPAVEQEPRASKPTSDWQDQGLKGKVRRVITEGLDTLFGGLSLDEEFNERGDLTRTVLFRDKMPYGIPDAVRVYGFVKGDRVYSERKYNLHPTAGKNDEFKTELFRIKFKFDKAGQLSEMRIIQEDGKDREKFVYSDGKIERTYNLMAEATARWDPLNVPVYKDTMRLDPSGNIIELTQTVKAAAGRFLARPDERPAAEGTDVFRYTYEFDDKGNWIKRIAVLVTKVGGKTVETPRGATRRTITYY